ncbi:MAG: class I SAM-dependent methyltransferase [Desulfobacterales bacterium]|nr:hypothetical protein [Desulfobacter sp.]MDP6394091.1 class I SAM-dependent methyltransferase [Desulfobacterales bacterium]MDP6684183.1 class I SAM-dependent methyltransferase [Desulfobacterales bacterium]MDP6806952.1 class I SAM-dependent methyltransferase [Desulfobacterales bacterium]|tara:strand:- start:77217 stop:77840 length:624 start_codon:yes stop_codon:yes gene_type:complete
MKNYLYKLFINRVTNYCYQNCLNYVSENTSILDVGIGNGVMMENFHDLIKSKRLNITGIDINEQYLNHCECVIQNHHLQDYVEIQCERVENFLPLKTPFYSFILFSMSFMLVQDQGRVLDRVKKWLKPDGKILFFQTMFKEKMGLMEFIKPKLKYVTTIDFGEVIYENDFFNLLKSKELAVVEDRLIKREWFKGEYRMIITTPYENS